jgi:hypothetical protein
MRLFLGLLVLCLSLAAGNGRAHHSYAMFDPASTRSVNGTVAKLEWKNPHAFLWVYVPSRDKPGAYDLWAFENGSPSALQGLGWNKSVINAGDRISVEYWPLRDGTPGGHCEKVSFADGRTLRCPSELGGRK